MKSLNTYINEGEGKKTYTVAVPVSGFASVIVEASNEQEAKKLALNTDKLGENDYYWWYDENNIKVGVVEGEESCPNEIAYSGCKLDESKLKGWKIV